MRCLIVEDSERLRKYMAKGVQTLGYAVDTAPDGDCALLLLADIDYDVVILDIMLPEKDGYAVLEGMKRSGHAAGVIIVSAKDTVDDRVQGLTAGADDYLVKPFALTELQARVKALVRRRYAQRTPVVECDLLRLNLNTRQVWRDGQPLDMRPRELALLEYMMLRQGQMVTRRELELHLYDDDRQPASNAVEAAISTLRKMIDVPGQISFIRTRRGLGYMIGGVEE